MNKTITRKDDGLKLIVGMAGMEVSDDRNTQLVTYALGSCLGIAVYDPRAGVGGLLHVMMPDSAIDTGRAQHNPFKFVDTGVPKLFRACYDLGARKEHMVLKVAGGACNKGTDNDYFQIGKRNLAMLRKLLWKNNVLIARAEVGGSDSRTMILDVGTGQVTLRVNGKEFVL